jgi:hypothetical protein
VLELLLQIYCVALFLFTFLLLDLFIIFHLRASVLAFSNSFKVLCSRIPTGVFSSPSALNGIPVGLGESSMFTIEEERGVITLGVVCDLVIFLL